MASLIFLLAWMLQGFGVELWAQWADHAPAPGWVEYRQ